ncbi:MAG: response regulator [Chloroflexi bacterium]|nr:response regulator [Chloroflexota bacterium]
MLVRFWGTRGSIPVPSRATVGYGGNTACVQVETAGGAQIILDCGTGARELGLHLCTHLPSPAQVSLLLSHTHWDHIQGIPFFAPVYQEGSSVTFYGARGMNRQLGELLAAQMDSSYFPVRLDQLRAEIGHREVGEAAFQIGDALIQPRYLNHTTLCLGYRITVGGASVVYATDHEPYTHLALRPGGEVLHAGDLGLIAFARDADLLIHDAQYSDDEYPGKIGWGHSTARYAASIAAAAHVKRLALFHHDPAHSDEFLDRHVERTRELLADLQAPPEVFAAAEGEELRLAGAGQAGFRGERVQVAAQPAARRPRVLIADDNRLIVRMIQDALAEDGYELLVANDGEQAVSRALAERPDLMILDVEMPRATGFEVCARLRREPDASQLPVIMLTSLDQPQDMARGFEAGVSDYITKPFTRTILRARVRSWLVRSGVV